MNDLTERRKKERFNVQNGVFAVAMPFSILLGQLIDINKQGLSFQYIADEIKLNKSSELGIFLTGKGFQLKEIPIKIISDISTKDTHPSISMAMKRCSVEYKTLTQEQISQLENIMLNYTDYADR